jgi:RND family efflux transporter MFP subunit
LTAPFPGDITARYVDVGARVGPGTSAFTLVDSRTLRATVHLVDRDAVRVRPGQDAQLTTDAFPGRTFSGRVERVVKALDRATRTLAAEIDIVNDDDALRPGMFGRVAITVETHHDAVTVPAASLIVQERSASLFVADGSTARRRAVRLGYDDGEWVEIVEGLRGDERVILEGKDLLSDGAPIRAISPPAETTPKAPTQAVDPSAAVDRSL